MSPPRVKGKERLSGGAVSRPGAEPRAPGPFGRYPGPSGMVVLAVLLLAFFSPMVFGGKVFLPPDIIASQSHRPFIQEVRQAGEYPLWTPYLFSGMPSLGSLIAAPGTNPFSTALGFLGPNVKPVAYYFLIGLFTFLLLRRRGLHPFAGFFAALSFVFCAHVIGWVMAGHTSKLATCVFLPAILLLVDWLFEKPGPLPAGLLALALGLSVVTSHMQITYYSLLAAGLFMALTTINRLRSRENLAGLGQAWAFFILAAALGAGASTLLSLPVREYADFSIRGAEGAGLTREYATNWSLHPLEVLTFFIPSFLGFGGPTYWGWMPFTDAPHYMGILPLFLAVVGIALRGRQRFTLFLLVLALFALFVAFGKEFGLLYDPLFRFLPGFNKFRVPSMALVLTQLSVALLAGVGLDALLETVPEAERRRRVAVFRKVFFAFGGLLLVLGLLALMGRGLIGGRALEKLGAAGEAAAFARAGRDVPVVFAVFGFGAGLLLAWLNRKASRTLALGAVAALTTLDLWLVGAQTAHYQTPAEDADLFRPSGTVEFLKKDSELFRILPLNAPLAPSPNWWAYFRLQNAHGYHPAKLKVYQDLIDDNGALGLTKPLQRGNFNLLRLLNVKYLIIDQPGLEGALGPLLSLVHTAGGSGGPSEYTYRINGTLPRAFFVDQVRVIPDPKQLLAAMADPAWQPAAQALLLKEPGAAIQPAAGSTAVITKYAPHHIEAQLDAAGTNFLVVSEVYFPPGWTARLDDREVPIQRVDYAFRGVVVPPGRHTLRFDMRDPAYERGKTISAASYGAIALLGLAGLLLERRRRPAGGATKTAPPPGPPAA